MTDGNISMEEDTELRDLVAQTLENNGVLAKVRAELRASVFLALEEQESVMNTEPLLNKTVKQYLANSEGKLLFSLVKEFLEYFGLDYTISVYDPETYSGKEYSYVGRNKLCEELGIASDEPLLGAILRNTLRGAFQDLSKRENGNDSNGNGTMETQQIESDACKKNFEDIHPTVPRKDSVSLSNDNDSSEKLDSVSEPALKIPINVTITDKKKTNEGLHNPSENVSNCQREIYTPPGNNDLNSDDDAHTENSNTWLGKLPASSEEKDVECEPQEREVQEIDAENHILNKTEPLIRFDESMIDGIGRKANINEENTKQNSMNNAELQNANNVQNKKQMGVDKKLGKTLYFDEIIIDGKKEKVRPVNRSDTSFLGDLPPLTTKATSIFGDLPSLKAKKTDINDLKELMDIGLGNEEIDNYEEDFVSSASGSANEQSPAKSPEDRDSPHKSCFKKEDEAMVVSQSIRSDDISEEIEGMEEILNSTSCLDDVSPIKTISNATPGVVADYIEEV